ncbi:hypothetical protein AK812_SmicGene10441 [Symbiodinium microadriaticum]|uniref:Uncharacterized protein n=1 Tax=Symbiodinium microadriaticum TaxID=2951 RepID=A0A1Q9EFR6_SYMMI|nr:hypothetical protein AK812_SmicGene10441 [Symbiodinium microadriaticum]
MAKIPQSNIAYNADQVDAEEGQVRLEEKNKKRVRYWWEEGYVPGNEKAEPVMSSRKSDIFACDCERTFELVNVRELPRGREDSPETNTLPSLDPGEDSDYEAVVPGGGAKGGRFMRWGGLHGRLCLADGALAVEDGDAGELPSRAAPPLQDYLDELLMPAADAEDEEEAQAKEASRLALENAPSASVAETSAIVLYQMLARNWGPGGGLGSTITGLRFQPESVDQSEAIRQILTCKIPRYGILEMALPEEGWGVFKGRWLKPGIETDIGGRCDGDGHGRNRNYETSSDIGVACCDDGDVVSHDDDDDDDGDDDDGDDDDDADDDDDDDDDDDCREKSVCHRGDFPSRHRRLSFNHVKLRRNYLLRQQQGMEVVQKAKEDEAIRKRRVTEGSKEQLPGTKLRAWDGSLAGWLVANEDSLYIAWQDHLGDSDALGKGKEAQDDPPKPRQRRTLLPGSLSVRISDLGGRILVFQLAAASAERKLPGRQGASSKAQQEQYIRWQAMDPKYVDAFDFEPTFRMPEMPLSRRAYRPSTFDQASDADRSWAKGWSGDSLQLLVSWSGEGSSFGQEESHALRNVRFMSDEPTTQTSTDAGGSSPFCKSELLVFLTFLEIMMALLMVLAGLGLVVAEPSGVVNSTLRGNEPRHLASCGVAGAVDCGVCKCTDRIACQWCDGNGGPASIGSSGPSNSPAPASTHASGSCPSNLVSCGVCTCTTRSACQYCDGYGGPARISVSASHRICGPLAALLAIPLAISLRK